MGFKTRIKTGVKTSHNGTQNLGSKWEPILGVKKGVKMGAIMSKKLKPKRAKMATKVGAKIPAEMGA